MHGTRHCQWDAPIVLLVLIHLIFSSNVFAWPESVRSTALQVQAKRCPTDAQWQRFDTITVDLLPDFDTDSTVQRSVYGGRNDKRVEATGFFYTKKIGDRWWLVDPDGYLFIHVGMAGTYRGPTQMSRATTERRFETPQKWAAFTAALLDRYGFNGVGGWSEGALLNRNAYKMPYTQSWNFMRDFARSKNISIDHRGGVLPVFHPDFESFCNAYAKERLQTSRDNPLLIGHFSDNELPFFREMLRESLRIDPNHPEQKYAYETAVRFLQDRKGKSDVSIEDVTYSDMNAFLEKVVDRYFAVTTGAIRQYDPNHLCLGARFHGNVKWRPEVFKAAARYLDVISINHYRAWSIDLYERADRARDLPAMWAEASDKPLLITEFYAKGMDSGMINEAGAGWTVPTQRDRGLFYQHFTLELLKHKNFVGWHWFKYRDNEPDDPDVHPGNVSSNKGIVTWDYQPYTDLLNEMKKVNRSVYALIDYFDDTFCDL